MKEILLDCSGINSPRELHHALAEQLSLPIWYGHNLDALHDCLTALPEDISLILTHFDTMGKWAIGFRRVMEDSCSENPHLTVTIQ